MTEAQSKSVKRAIHTAREAVVSDPATAFIRLRRFNRAMDALAPGEGEQVYDALRSEGWYQAASMALARATTDSRRQAAVTEKTP